MWNVVDSKLRSYGCVPTRADRCTYVLYSKTPLISPKSSTQPPKAETDNGSYTAALDSLLDPYSGNNARGFAPCGVICLHVDDLYMVGGDEFTKRVITRLRKDFQVGSEDRNDVTFVGQRIRWINGLHKGHICVDQKLAVEELLEIKFDKSLKDNVECAPGLHTEHRSVLGQLNWLLHASY